LSRVLVIQTAFLGDVVLTTPLFRALSDKPECAEVTALVTPTGARILGRPDKLVAGLSEVVVYDKRGAQQGLSRFFDMARTLRDKRFDIIISPHRSHRSAALARLTRAPIRIGFDENALPFIWTHRIERRRDIHDVERSLALLDPLGGVPGDYKPNPEVAVTPEGQNGAEKLAGDFLEAPLRIGIAPGSVWGTKRWPPEKFAAVIDALARDRAACFALVGGPKDAEVSATVKRLSHADVIDLAGKTTIEEMAALLARLDLFITNDTGPMHVAAALDVPVVAIFGATTPEMGFAPYTDKSRIVESSLPLECRPCSPHGPKKCPEGHFRCMNDITPEAVLKAAFDLLT